MSESRAAAAALECRLLAAAGLADAAARGYQQLAGRYADTVCLDGRTGRQLLAEITPESEVGQAPAHLSPWKAGATTVEVAPETTTRAAVNIYQPLFPAELQLEGDLIAERFGAVVDPQRQELVLSDRLGAECARGSRSAATAPPARSSVPCTICSGAASKGGC